MIFFDIFQNFYRSNSVYWLSPELQTHIFADNVPTQIVLKKFILLPLLSTPTHYI